MRRLIRTLECEGGKLYVTARGSRILLAQCKPKIEIVEDLQNIPILGKTGYSVRKRHFSIVLCKEPCTTRNIDADFLRSVTGFDLSVDIQRRDGVYENVIINNIIPTDIDLDGDWTFDVPEQPDLTGKLLEM